MNESALQKFCNSNESAALKAAQKVDLIHTLIQTAWTDFAAGYDSKAKSDVANIVKLANEAARALEKIQREAANLGSKFSRGDKPEGSTTRMSLRWPGV